MKRNVNATCGTCPFWHQNPKSTCGKCQAVSWTFIEKLDTEWCGQHPDFWEAEAAEQGALDCEPPQETLEEIVRLLNDNEHAEALKELRRMHGLVNRFVCVGCGYTTSTATSEGSKGFVCPKCGAKFEQRVVIQPKESAK